MTDRFRYEDFVFRWMNPSDAPFVADCFIDWPGKPSMGVVQQDVLAWSRATREAQCPLPDGAQQEAFIVVRQGEPVGIVRYDSVGKICYVSHHLVHPDKRGQGLHTMIVAMAFAYIFDDAEAWSCEFEVFANAGAVFAVGEKYGYELVREGIAPSGHHLRQMRLSREAYYEKDLRLTVECRF